MVCSSIILTIPSSLQNLRYRKTVSCGDWKDCLQGCKEKKEGKNMSEELTRFQIQLLLYFLEAEPKKRTVTDAARYFGKTKVSVTRR